MLDPRNRKSKNIGMTVAKAEHLLRITDTGLYCPAGDFYIDPERPVERAVITHGHGDHARPNHGRVAATAETIAIMRVRFGEQAGGHLQSLHYNEPVTIGDVRVRLAPAGHVLGSAQVVVEHGGCRVVVSGDYKRRPDPTCPPFEPVPCDLFVTEATFALPVFRHPPAETQVGKLRDSLALFGERAHAVGTYPLGKCQRILRLLRQAGYDRPIYMHGALRALCDLYERFGIDLGELRPVAGVAKKELAGEVVLAPPSALHDRWARRLPEPLVAVASGWMAIRQRAKQRRVELPLVISDHADWDELTQTVVEVGAPSLWVTHGREDALVHWARQKGIDAKPLYMTGREDDAE